MALFRKNPNEVLYPEGKKPFYSVIKNDGPGNVLIWKFLGEDFNNGSQLIVAENEQALFFSDGVIQEVFKGGKYTLETANYPFLSRLRNAFSGGTSAFHCKVYFVNLAHKLELLWGTDSPIQVRDPVWQIQTSLQARGSYSIRITDGKKFFLKLVGNNIQTFTAEEICAYFRSAFLQHIKSTISRLIRESNEEILGICERQDEFAQRLKPVLDEELSEYGVGLVNFYISGLDIPENDPNRIRLEESLADISVRKHGAMGYNVEIQTLGDNWGKVQATEILHKLAENEGAGGMAATGAGMGMGIGAGQVVANMASEIFRKADLGTNPVGETEAQFQGQTTAKPSRFATKSAAEKAAPSPSAEGAVCPSCQTVNPPAAKFCMGCGKPVVRQRYCINCGKPLPDQAKFCMECGTANP